MYETIKNQILALMLEMTLNPKPSYNVDGQSVAWTDYLKQLQTTVDWCDKQMMKDNVPVEEITQGGSEW
jgi:hypothetical protein